MEKKIMTKKKIVFLLMVLMMPVCIFAGNIALNIPYLATFGEKEIKDIIAKSAEAGAGIIKVNASYSGNRPYAFQTSPGVYNEKALKKLDLIVSEAGLRQMKVIITLMDNSKTYGGKEVYAQWTGGFNEDVFFKDKLSREYFKKYIDKLTSRKNTVSGEVYTNDPAITGWDLCSEAENKNDSKDMALYKWAEEMSKYLASKSTGKSIIISLKKTGDSQTGAGSNDIYLIPYISSGVFYLSAGKQLQPAKAISYIKNYVSMILGKTGKPAIMVFTDLTNSPGSIKKAASEFFASGGETAVFSFAANKAYSAYPGAIDLTSSAIISEIKEASRIALNAKPAGTLVIKQPRVITDDDEAQITVKLPEAGNIEVQYGTSMPLKLSVPRQAINLSGTIYIKNLKPDTEYLYLIKAGTGNSRGVSSVYSFRTQKTEKIAALPFKMSGNFISASKGKFWDGQREYRYFGTNNYYIRQRDNDFIDAMFKQFYDAGIKVVRVGSNGEAESMEKIDKNDIGRWFRIGPDYFNEDAYKRIDYVLDSASRHNVRVILHFTDNWEYYGGVKVYATWAGVSKNDFWTNEECKRLYKQTVDAYVLRKNTVNGKLYKNDPTIFAYDLMNEPRNEADQTGKTMTNWMDEMSAYIKSKDSNHMVTSGSDAFFLKEDGTHYSGTDFIQNHRVKGIDFCTFHMYPTYEHNSFSKSTTEWLIKKFINEAHKTVGKPVVMEEYGIPNKSDIYDKAEWIEFMTGTFFNNGGNGANYWFYIDESYEYGDGFDVKPSQTEYVNIFVKYANMINKNGY